MAFIREVTAAIALITLTLSFQSTGMAVLIRWGNAYLARSTHRFGLLRSADLLARITHLMICLHILEILLWAAFYRWKCLPSWESAFYFSTTSYSIVGYGDILLPHSWRLLGPVESVTGVLMCGLSASLLFAIVTRLVGHEERFLPALAKGGV